MLYLIQPYTHSNPAIRAIRAEIAAGVVADYMIKGIHVYSPVVHGHATLGKRLLNPDESSYYDHGMDMLTRCSGALLLPLNGWEWSRGVMLELRYVISSNLILNIAHSDWSNAFTSNITAEKVRDFVKLSPVVEEPLNHD